MTKVQRLTLPRALATVFLALAIGGSATAAQNLARLSVVENFRASPDGDIVGQLQPGLEFPIISRRSGWLQVELTGWVWTRSLQVRGGEYDLLVTAPGGENLRDGPSGNIVGRLSQNALLDEIERAPGWVNVRRVGWIWAESVSETLSAGALADTAAGPALDPQPEPPPEATPRQDTAVTPEIDTTLGAEAEAPSPAVDTTSVPAAAEAEERPPSWEAEVGGGAPGPGGRGGQQAYALRSGDKVTIELFTAAGQEVDVVGDEHTIDVNGDIFLPYVGTLRAAGLDQSELRHVLAMSYGTYYPDPVIDVTVQLRVNITGGVGGPGQYFLDPTTTLVDALSVAGGMTSELAVSALMIPSNQREVRLMRGSETFILNLRPGEATDEVLAMRIQSGDWIDVPYVSRSRIRDDILFFGTVVSFISSVATMVIILR